MGKKDTQCIFALGKILILNVIWFRYSMRMEVEGCIFRNYMDYIRKCPQTNARRGKKKKKPERENNYNLVQVATLSKRKRGCV